MLRRYRQFRTKVHRWVDLSLFAIGLWLAHCVRDAVPLGEYLGWIPALGGWLERKLTDTIFPFHEYIWLYLIILPIAPLVLESQGFYQRPLFFSRRQTAA